MKINVVKRGLVIAGITVSSIAATQTRTPVINQRKAAQENRITQGVNSGALTNHEARTLKKDERNISAEKRIAKANGKVGPRERTMIRHQENRYSRAIYRKKHNRRVN